MHHAPPPQFPPPKKNVKFTKFTSAFCFIINAHFIFVYFILIISHIPYTLSVQNRIVHKEKSLADQPIPTKFSLNCPNPSISVQENPIQGTRMRFTNYKIT
jgi:hypothetical protein